MESRSKPSLAAVIGCMIPMMLGFCFLCPSMDCLWHKYHYCPRCGEKVPESLSPLFWHSFFFFFLFLDFWCFSTVILLIWCGVYLIILLIFLNIGCWLREIRSLRCDGSSILGREEFCINQLNLICGMVSLSAVMPCFSLLLH